ncbi:MAG: selenocysteine-specific translation elongation factor [Oribacterium parvum]|uniref:selenocysteine-specific translation elongation factor n=1 Tax=Oribacterium parvum TaxID=1501329 RepID=UPI001CAF6AEC|nr:selenocysteine-specific translation elongation factor [Oribacterium parvum]MBF1268223.1 selenocysteine-specific translation elongation factor [Oribacterium parvum]
MEGKHFIIGTAGHIDHGKTALVKALTGYDTDRLKEEKKRGMTIELGFTSLSLFSGEKIGLIDTPGHEKFIRTMVAGAMGMDLVLLVISAKEGIMPQTVEHLAILRLLNVTKIVVVLTMIDLVEASIVQKRKEEIKEFFKAEKIEIFPVSAYTGEGIQDLSTFLSKKAGEVEGKSIRGSFRMPIDRVFSVAGAGTIVTGTALSGRVLKSNTEAENEIKWVLYPEEREIRIRNIQVHGKDVNCAYAGERIALNLQGVEKEQCYKGELIGEKGALQPSSLFDCRIESIRGTAGDIHHNQRMEILLGTAHIPCKVVFLEGDRIKEGESVLVQLQLEEKTVAVFGERFILRDESRSMTLGGGVVLDPCPKGRHRRGRFPLAYLESMETGGEEALLHSYLKKRKRRFVSISELKRQFSGFSRIQAILGEEASLLFVIVINGEAYALLSEEEELIRKEVEDYLHEFHKKNPYKLGEKPMVLYSRLFSSYNKNTYKALLRSWEEKKCFRFGEDFIALVGYKMVKDEKYTKIANALVNDMQKAKFSFIKLSEHFWLPEEKKLLPDVIASLENKGTLVQLDGEYYTLRKLFESLKNFSLEKMEKEGEITIDALREEFGISRKNAKLFFKATDKMGITKDRGFESARSMP